MDNIDEIAVLVSAFLKGRSWNQPGWKPERPPAPKSNHLSAEDLAKVYARDGIRGARVTR